jgi:hypothetical protein
MRSFIVPSRLAEACAREIRKFCVSTTPALGIRTQAFADFDALGRLAGKPLLRLGRRRRQRSPHYPVTPQKNTEISPLFECDSATRAFYGLKDGKITVNFSGWEQNRVVLKGAKPLR